jgi:hypothetical protein
MAGGAANILPGAAYGAIVSGNFDPLFVAYVMASAGLASWNAPDRRKAQY